MRSNRRRRGFAHSHAGDDEKMAPVHTNREPEMERSESLTHRENNSPPAVTAQEGEGELNKTTGGTPRARGSRGPCDSAQSRLNSGFRNPGGAHQHWPRTGKHSPELTNSRPGMQPAALHMQSLVYNRSQGKLKSSVTVSTIVGYD